MRAVTRLVKDDRARAERARREPLPSDVRALGSSIRELNRRQAHSEDAAAITVARNAVDRDVRRVLGEHGPDTLRDLRAAQLEAFLAAVRRYEDDPASPASDELSELAGAFVTRMNDVGWCDAKTHRCLMDDDERRVAFKITWNGIVGVAEREELRPTLDEMRVLYTFYLRHAHVPEQQRGLLSAERAAASTVRDAVAACAAANQRERRAIEGWRLDKVNKLGALDPSYPLAFARGVVQYRMGNYEAAMQSFTTWLDAHPNGPLTIRARNHLKAAMQAAR
jgi:hypothetical protein